MDTTRERGRITDTKWSGMVQIERGCQRDSGNRLLLVSGSSSETSNPEFPSTQWQRSVKRTLPRGSRCSRPASPPASVPRTFIERSLNDSFLSTIKRALQILQRTHSVFVWNGCVCVLPSDLSYPSFKSQYIHKNTKTLTLSFVLIIVVVSYFV